MAAPLYLPKIDCRSNNVSEYMSIYLQRQCGITHKRISSSLRRWAEMAKEPRWKRMNLNVETSLHDAFKASTASKGEKMTDVLLQFIREYVQKHPPTPRRSQKE